MDALQFSLEKGRLVRGAIAGLAGGLVGLLTHGMDVMPVSAALADATNVAVRGLLHLAIAAGLGAAYGAFVLTASYGRGMLHGVVWGLVVWLIAAVVAARTFAGMPVAIDPSAVSSLVGHVAYGLALGISAVALERQAEERRSSRGVGI